jgi:proteasome accessory factor C
MFNQHKIYRVLQLITQLQNKPSKSVRFMANFLECTERTTYRYIDLLKQLGFDVQKDEHNKFFIVGENQTEEYFTSEESTFLIEMVKTVGKENLLKDAILKKIYLKSEISQQANALFKAHLSKLVEKLNVGIANNKKVILKQYHSVNTNKISDRLVEPIQFTENYNAICAYEVESQITKYFNLERIIDVEVLENEQEFHNLHSLEPTDVFGFTERNGQKFQIELQLSLRAYILFKEANSSLEKNMTKIENSERYLLKVNVNNPKPIVSLIRGFRNEIKIIGSKAFVEFIKTEESLIK